MLAGIKLPPRHFSRLISCTSGLVRILPTQAFAVVYGKNMLKT